MCCTLSSTALEDQSFSALIAYNKVNGIYACENNYTLNHVLKGEMGYLGFVVSDWGATHSTVASANHGLDMVSLSFSYVRDGVLY